ncbi:MAG: LptA/OstA family protein [Acidobacteriota bacterium]
MISQKVGKTILGMFLISILGIFLFEIIIRIDRENTKKQEEIKQTKDDKIQLKTNINYVETKGGKKIFQVNSLEHYLGNDNLFHLKGNVCIRIFNKAPDNKDLIIEGEEGFYPKDFSSFKILKNSKIISEKNIIESEYFEYFSKNEEIKTDKKTKFMIRNVEGTSTNGMNYYLNEKKVSLNNLEKALMEVENEESVIFHGERFNFLYDQNKGELINNTSIAQGENILRANSINFKLDEEKNHIKEIEAFENAFLRFSQVEKKEIIKNIDNKPGLRKIAGNKIFLEIFPDGKKPFKGTCSGNCEYITEFLNSQEKRKLASEFMKFEFYEEGGIKNFEGIERVLMEDNQKRFYGDSISLEFYPGENKIRKGNIQDNFFYEDMDIKLWGAFSTIKDNIIEVQGFRPKIVYKENQIVADKLIINNEKNYFEGAGNIRTTMIDKNNKIGFFSDANEPIFISSDKIFWSRKNDESRFIGNTGMWKGNESLMAEEIHIEGNEGNLKAFKNCQFEIFYEKKDGGKKKIKCKADEISFLNKQKLISLSDESSESSLLTEEFEIKGNRMYIYLTEKKILEKINVEKNVKIQYGDFLISGEKVEWDIVDEKMEVTGNPELNDKNRGMIKGRKVIVDFANDKIVTESREEERSITIIKSQKEKK